MKAPDRCPGVLRPHLAADGALIRVRVPGGQTDAAALARLGAVARRHGSGLLQLTSRGSVQLRGLPETIPDAVVDELTIAGFLPSAGHERVRNITASPLTGLSGGVADLRPMISELDRAIVDVPELADLPGRFLFVLDDGRGDVAGLALDLGYRALAPDHGLLLVGSGHHGRPIRADAVVSTMIDLARRFLAARTDQWHIRELGQLLSDGLQPLDRPTVGVPPIGAVDDHASVAVPLGLLSPSQLDALLAVADAGPLVITPWRGLVLPHAADRLDDLAAAGLIVDDESAWTMISACVGAPWCTKARADTRSWARDLASAGRPATRTHLSGCERRCGAPSGPHLDLVADQPLVGIDHG